MTYCLAFRLHDGLIFLADTRTNAGVDNVGTYRKQHVLRPADDRIFVVEFAGSLATVEHLFEAALYIGRLSREVAAEHHHALSQAGADGTATFILGGQIAGDEHGRANVSVGPPYDAAIYRNDTLKVDELRIDESSPFLAQLDAVWTEHMLAAIAHLPVIPTGLITEN